MFRRKQEPFRDTQQMAMAGDSDSPLSEFAELSMERAFLLVRIFEPEGDANCGRKVA